MSEAALDVMSPQQVAQAVMEAGYRAQIEKREDGDYVIRSMASGYKCNIFCYSLGGNPERVASLQFHCAFGDLKPSMDKVNAWNRQKRFVKVYVDSDGDAGFEMDVSLRGVSTAYVKNCMERWDAIIGDAPTIEALQS